MLKGCKEIAVRPWRRVGGRTDSGMPDTSDVKFAEQRIGRILMPGRQQVQFREFHLDGAVPADPRVRAVWTSVEALDLSALCWRIGSVEGGLLRPATDPRILPASSL